MEAYVCLCDVAWYWAIELPDKLYYLVNEIDFVSIIEICFNFVSHCAGASVWRESDEKCERYCSLRIPEWSEWRKIFYRIKSIFVRNELRPAPATEIPFFTHQWSPVFPNRFLIHFSFRHFYFICPLSAWNFRLCVRVWIDIFFFTSHLDAGHFGRGSHTFFRILPFFSRLIVEHGTIEHKRTPSFLWSERKWYNIGCRVDAVGWEFSVSLIHPVHIQYCNTHAHTGGKLWTTYFLCLVIMLLFDDAIKTNWHPTMQRNNKRNHRPDP